MLLVRVGTYLLLIVPILDIAAGNLAVADEATYYYVASGQDPDDNGAIVEAYVDPESAHYSEDAAGAIAEDEATGSPETQEVEGAVADDYVPLGLPAEEDSAAADEYVASGSDTVTEDAGYVYVASGTEEEEAQNPVPGDCVCSLRACIGNISGHTRLGMAIPARPADHWSIVRAPMDQSQSGLCRFMPTALNMFGIGLPGLPSASYQQFNAGTSTNAQNTYRGLARSGPGSRVQMLLPTPAAPPVQMCSISGCYWQQGPGAE